MSSQAGRIFLTSGPTLGYGVQWFPIGDPSDLDSTYAPALAFGAPANATAPLSNFIYAGTVNGHIFVTTTGGGVGTPWKNISNGLDNSPVQFIVTNPTRGSNEAYAVTSTGVFWMPDSSVAAPTWINITGNLFSAALVRTLFNDPAQALATLQDGLLTSIQADWRYAIPDNLADPTGPTHPVLYVAGVGGVYRSLDKGKTWTYFPDETIDGAEQQGGYFPSAQVTNLALSLGNIDPLDGTPSQPYGRSMLVATTYGMGDYAIRLNDQIMVPGGNALYTYAVSAGAAGPHVGLVRTASSTGNGVSIDGMQITFSGPVDPATFTTAKVNSVTDPFGDLIPVASIFDTVATNHNVYDIEFASTDSAYGFYHVSLGPNISDYSGDKMDQNQNGINGEDPGDIYSARFLYQPFANHAPVLTDTNPAFPPAIDENGTTATIVTGGSGYKLTDILTVTGGTIQAGDGYLTTLEVTKVTAGGAVTGVLVLSGGLYSTLPTNAVGVTDSTTPAATGAKFDLTFLSGASVNSFVLSLGWPASGLTDPDEATYQANTPPTTAPIGIAVTGVDNTNGDWQYSLNNGATWTDFGATGGTDSFPSAAVLLEANSNGIASPDNIRFVPNPDFHGTAAFTFLGWDLTSGLSVYGADGGTVDLTQPNATGGTTAFSLITDPGTATLTINEVNHPPLGTKKTVSTPEDTPYVFKPADCGFSDPNDSPPNNFKAVEITTLPALGKLTDNGVAVTAGEFVPVTDITGGKFLFTPVTTFYATPYTSCTFQVQDDGGTANGGIDTDIIPRTMTFNVTFVNHAPIGTSTTVTLLENTTYTFQTADFGFTDPNDNPHNTFKAVEITTLPALGTLTDNGVAVTAHEFIPVADITGNLLVFTPVTAGWGSPYTSFTFQVQDNGGTANGGVDTDPNPKTMTIDVTEVNHAPLGTNNTVTTLEDKPYTFKTADFGFSDPHDTPANTLLAVEISTLPGVGTLTDSGVAVTAGQFVPVADISGGKLIFTPAANANGASYASFTFQVQDNGGTANGGSDTDPTPKTMTIDVTSVNDAPVGTSNTVTTLEDHAPTRSRPPTSASAIPMTIRPTRSRRLRSPPCPRSAS